MTLFSYVRFEQVDGEDGDLEDGEFRNPRRSQRCARYRLHVRGPRAAAVDGARLPPGEEPQCAGGLFEGRLFTIPNVPPECQGN